MNPLLNIPKTSFDSAPFDLIKMEHYLPAFEQGIESAKQNLEKIKNHGEPANFENTILAMELSGEQLDHVSHVFMAVKHANGDKPFHDLAKTIMPLLSNFSNDLYLDSVLFAKVQEVYEARESKGYTPEQMTLVEKTYLSFSRNGALLDENQKQTLRDLDRELAKVRPLFGENLLAATNAFEMIIEDEKDLSGLPDSAIEAAQEEAEKKGYQGKWLFTLQFPSYGPFMSYADNRDLREKMATAFRSRSVEGEHSNKKVIQDIASLLHKRANLLGYETYAQFQLEERMAQTPQKVMDFLDVLLVNALPAAKREVEELRQFKKKLNGEGEFMSWDSAYYTDKLRKEKFDFDEEKLRPYFELNASLNGAFVHAEKLYNLKFTEKKDIAVYHEDVRVFVVSDLTSGEHKGLFYTDFFPRETKQAGAWCTRFKTQGIEAKGNVRPHVSIVCNFTKPTATKPSLLTFREVETLFHEFGHALHSLLSKCSYKSLSCTAVYRDFVELPSQVLENWNGEKEGLDLFAKHYQTGESLPAEYLEKIKENGKFNQGSLTVRQLNFSMLDMAWYSDDPSKITDVVAFEEKATEKTKLLPSIEGTSISCSFGHIFAGGYSAGYYSYKWAEVLDADAFEYFKEKGIFNREVADKFRKHILEKGGSEHPMVLYKRFRGREPDPTALLRRAGLIS